ncbi:MAG: ABC transporter ATP-binding protein [Chloracidobacterium sp.]|nr:ABC transporter ATP-binding protein [Chloracidobacterium sp.]MDW8217074.1 ABC transporter ATP-binding protein [Acidobacteriota bacterium]
MVYTVGRVAVRALDNVTFSVRQGEFVAVVGQSGSGKSTLLHVLGGLLRPTSGSVLIDGQDLATVSDRERTAIRRQKIGIVFQRFNLFPTLSAEGNLRLAERIRGVNGSDPAHRRELLRLLNLEHRLHHKPLELSGGEQQRVAVARALINRPKLLLADEPTGNLDSENSQIVLDMLKRLNQELQQTVILITHNPEAAAVGSRIIALRDGKIIADRPNNAR